MKRDFLQRYEKMVMELKEWLEQKGEEGASLNAMTILVKIGNLEIKYKLDY